jgi:hypothetical protein
MSVLIKTMRTFFVAILLVFQLNSFSQSFKLGIQSGYGSYSMSGLKGFNSFVVSSIPFETRVVDSYPSYVYYQPSLIYSFNDFSFGALYSYQSTGSRISSVDYSGEYKLDTRIKTSAIGFSIEHNFRIVENPMPYFAPYLKLGYMFTSMQLNEFLRVYDETYVDYGLQLSSDNYFIEPGIKIGYGFGKLDTNLSLGYLFQFGDGYLKGPNKTYLITDKDKKISPDWSGFRLGISLVFRIFSLQ